MQNDQNLSKKTLAEWVERLASQYTDLNRRLNRISYGKVKQDVQLKKFGEENHQLWQRLQELHGQFEQLTAAAADKAEQGRIPVEQPTSAKPGSSIQTEHQTADADLEKLEEELASLQTEQQDQTTLLAEVHNSLSRLSNEMDDMRRESAEITAHVRRLEESESELEVRDTEYAAKVYDLQGNVAELELQLEHKLSQAAQTVAQPPRKPFDHGTDLKQSIEQLERLQTQSGNLYKELERRLLDLSNRMGETNARTQLADTRVDRQQERVALLQQTLEERIGELESMMLALKAASEQVETEMALDELDQRLKLTEQQIPSLEETIRNLHDGKLPKADIIPLSERIDAGETGLSQQKVEITGLHRQLDEMAGRLATQAEETARIDGLYGQIQTLQQDSAETREHNANLEGALHDFREQASAESSSHSARLQLLSEAIEEDRDARLSLERQLSEQTSNTEQRLHALSAAQIEQEALHRASLDEHQQRFISLEQNLQTLSAAQAEQQALHQSTAEAHQQRLVSLEQDLQSLEQDQTELQSGQQQLTTRHSRLAEELASTADQGSKHQTEIQRLKLNLTQLNDGIANIRLINWRQTLAIGGAFLLVLLMGFAVHQLLQQSLHETETSLTQLIQQQGENSVSREELEQLVQAGPASDEVQLEAVRQAQQQLASRLTEMEAQQAASSGAGSAAPALEHRLGEVEVQNQTALEERQEQHATIELLQQTLAGLRQDLHNRSLPESARHWQDWAAARSYSIQLIGVSNQASLLDYAARSGLTGERAILHTRRAGGDWYVLLHGLYPTAREATEALDTLPEPLRNNQPWVRLLPADGAYTPF